MEVLWQQCDAALQEKRDVEGDDDADAGRFVRADGTLSATAAAVGACPDAHAPHRVVPLADGGFHVCFGLQCEHAVLDPDAQTWVCEATGLVLGVHAQRNRDPGWTGRSVASVNPDNLSGTPRYGWRKKLDQWAASVHANKLSHRLADAVVDDRLYAEAATGRAAAHAAAAGPAVRAPSKRGAQCVDVRDAPPPPPPPPDRAAAGAPAMDALQRKKLEAEAHGVVTQLLAVHHALSAPAASASASASASADARLQSIEFVLKHAFAKLVAEARSGKRPLHQSAVHDVCLKAHEFVRAQRRTAADRNAQTLAAAAAGPSEAAAARPQPLSGIGRRLCVDLVLRLWKAALATPHMRADGKRSTDSFRPFVAGVLFGFKRGARLANGAVIIPVLPCVAALLPQLRSQSAKPTAKQLQSSSHRGLCSLHRAIASLDDLPPGPERDAVDQLFQHAAQRAERLRRYLDSGQR